MATSNSPPAPTTAIDAWSDLYASRPFLLELFVLSNLGFLILDVYLAHSFNDFAHWGEWVPVYFSVLGTGALGVAVWQEARRRTSRSRWIGFVVGWSSILVGLAGLVWHLEGWFFESVTILSLVYSAPFVAPLSFTGLGCLLLLNRMEDPDTRAWGQWVVFLAWGGFGGNFALSLIDHAQNAFFYWTEWIPVVVGALGVGMLGAILLRPVTRNVLQIGYAVLLLYAATGLLGFALHVAPLFSPETLDTGLWDTLRFSAPVFAPLLFVDLAALAALGLWDLDAKRSPSNESLHL